MSSRDRDRVQALLSFEYNLERLIKEDGFTAELEGLFGRSTMANAIAKRIKGAESEPADRSLQFLLKNQGNRWVDDGTSQSAQVSNKPVIFKGFLLWLGTSRLAKFSAVDRPR